MKLIKWIKEYWLVGLCVIAMILLTSVGLFAITNHTWNVETGIFVRAEFHPERVLNVTWIQLEDKELMYGTYNPEVLDLIPGNTYEFGEGLISGNFGKRLVWIKEVK